MRIFNLVLIILCFVQFSFAVELEEFPESVNKLMTMKQSDQGYEIQVYKASIDLVSSASLALKSKNSGKAIKLLTYASSKLHWRGDLRNTLSKAISQYTTTTNKLIKMKVDCSVLNKRYDFLLKFSPDSISGIKKLPKVCKKQVSKKGIAKKKKELKRIRNKVELLKFKEPEPRKDIETYETGDLLGQLGNQLRINKNFPLMDIVNMSFVYFQKVVKDHWVRHSKLKISPKTTSDKEIWLEADSMIEDLKYYRKYQKEFVLKLKELVCIGGDKSTRIGTRSVKSLNELSYSTKCKMNKPYEDYMWDFYYPLFGELNSPDYVVFKHILHYKDKARSYYTLQEITQVKWKQPVEGSYIGTIGSSKLFYSEKTVVNNKHTPPEKALMFRSKKLLKDLKSIETVVDLNKTYELYLNHLVPFVKKKRKTSGLKFDKALARLLKKFYKTNLNNGNLSNK